MSKTLRVFICIFGLFGLAACGDGPLEQTLLGAGAGAGTAAILDGNILTGAAVGAAGNVIYCQTGKRKRC